MRVFVIGTGRCGSTTFTRAAKHATNYTASHESTSGMVDPARLAFADNRIEVSPHLTWMLGPLVNHNQLHDMMFVHLQRRREEVINSWVKRGPDRGPGLWTPLAMRRRGRAMTPAQYRAACGLCYDSIVGMIDPFLAGWEQVPSMVRPMHIWLHDIEKQWPLFWRRIGAKGNYKASLAEWKTRYNAS